ncbi:hypothetical protein [Winogradskyella aurantia]|uniref:Uncharacterized protein n=1 Tax=Winogradskyella aurantia TaxID=1915063 RepID=A0A265UXK9_9FLAO|nr:hypothetical protein [Winogradskyella aurantia]OZV69962.1 hypothetical protein CA834_04915 [Winogradskyella aurantia]
MKNFGLLILGIVIGAVFMHFYSTKQETTLEQAIVPPKGLIKPAEAMALDKAFDIKHRIINDSLFKQSADGGDNRSSWYSIDEIENYIMYAKDQAQDLGYTLDGLRVYLGSYPNAKDKAGLTTMFFIPTGTKNISKGSFLNAIQNQSPDIPGGDGLNRGSNGIPPGENYPQ